MESLDSYAKYLEDEFQRIESEPKTTIVPSNFQILFSGVSDGIGLRALLSPKLDQIIGKLFDKILSGDFDSVSDNADQVQKVLDKIGIKDTSFTGPVSTTIMNSIEYSVNSPEFKNNKNKVKKINILIKDLKRKRKTIPDKITQKKYDDALYAIKKVYKLAFRIYLSRGLINKRAKRGLNNIVNEAAPK